MKTKAAGALVLLLAINANAQRAATAANFTLRTTDTIQTCYRLSEGAHENLLPTQSCAGVAAINTSFAVGSFLFDKIMRRRHPKLALAQWISAAGSAQGIVFTFTIGNRRKP